MPWKTEIDRLVHQIALDVGPGGGGDARRAARTVGDLLALTPDRAESHFHAGTLLEALARSQVDALARSQVDALARSQVDALARSQVDALARSQVDALARSQVDALEDAPDVEPEEAGDPLALLPEPTGAGRRWRHLGRLDAASRRGPRERMAALMADPLFEECLAHAEGRIALRSVGRALLREGRDAEIFDLYVRHLAAVGDEGGRRDAEFLLEEALRRADRGDVDEGETLARLERASDFARRAGLDSRAQSKVDRKLGRIHQLHERWEDATSCYARALERLPADDPYRSVLVGDLALAMLGVRGTLDLLPGAPRENAERAIVLLEQGEGGEGRSYNAIYTLGLLAYEKADWERAAECFREADRLMRENRAKARIVHARARFFLARCLLELGAEGEALEEAKRSILRDAHAVSLDPERKAPVFEALSARDPEARVPGRPAPRRAAEPARPSPTGHLEAAVQALQAGRPLDALASVDRAFKSRPDFETWFGSYRVRLSALLTLEEQAEAIRTYERFRAKLFQREALDRVETLLTEDGSPLPALLGDAAYHEELVGLYERRPDRVEDLVRACVAAARAHHGTGRPEALARAFALLREAAAHAPDAVRDDLAAVEAAARAARVLPDAVGREETRALLAPEEEPVRVLVVGDPGRPALRERVEALAKDLGFEVEWLSTGALPPYKAMREIEAAADDSDVVLLHHGASPELVADMDALSRKIDIPVHRATWLGLGNLEHEVLLAVKQVFTEEQPA
jgi:tetratricopeptide (TPR) repeat protein